MFTSPEGLCTDTRQTIMHYKILKYIIYTRKKVKKPSKFPFKIPTMNKMLKPTKLSLDQEILLCIVTIFAFVFVENPCD